MRQRGKKVFASALLLLAVLLYAAFDMRPVSAAAITGNGREPSLEKANSKAPGSRVKRKRARWISKGSKKYYLDENGRLVKGWKRIQSDWYYFNSRSGALRTGWFTMHGKTYYFGKDGRGARGLKKIGGSRYFFNDRGRRASGWKKIGSATYYFTKAGRSVTGWRRLNGSYYYFNEKGRMKTGWLKLGRKKYYLLENGTRAAGDLFLDGQWRHFKKNGVYDPKSEAVLKIDPGRPMVALTFDDGPGPYTERLLNCIERYRARATFFLVGQNVPRYADVVGREYRLKCEIGNHTYDHPQLTHLSQEQITAQIGSTNNNIRNITGHDAALLRPPYGNYNSLVTSLAGTPVIMWSIDTRDWETRNTQSTVNAVLNYVRDGDIVLMHDIHLPTVEAAEIIIPELLRRGYQLVTVSELGYYKRGGLASGAVYASMYN